MDDKTYNSYVRFCERLGIKPAPLELYRATADHFVNSFGQIGKVGNRSAHDEKNFPRPH